MAADLLDGGLYVEEWPEADVADLGSYQDKIDAAGIAGMSDDDREYMRRMIFENVCQSAEKASWPSPTDCRPRCGIPLLFLITVIVLSLLVDGYIYIMVRRRCVSKSPGEAAAGVGSVTRYGADSRCEYAEALGR